MLRRPPHFPQQQHQQQSASGDGTAETVSSRKKGGICCYTAATPAAASDPGGDTGTRSSKPCSPSTGTGPQPSATCSSIGGFWFPPPSSNTTIIATTGSPCGPAPPPTKRRPTATTGGRSGRAASAAPQRRRQQPPDSSSLTQLREQIFPTIYAAFQQCRGGVNGGLCSNTVKVRNRTLRSLTRSCLYHRKLEQLERTQRDAEELLERLCRRRGYTSAPAHPARSLPVDESCPPADL